MTFHYFEWVTEGILIFIVGIIGLLGNATSVWTFWRQPVHRIFHNLLLTLAIFDSVSTSHFGQHWQFLAFLCTKCSHLAHCASVKVFRGIFMSQIYVACSIHIYSLVKLWPSYDQWLRKRSMPIVLPVAYTALMGSVYCTVALAIERCLAVRYPFLRRQ